MWSVMWWWLKVPAMYHGTQVSRVDRFVAVNRRVEILFPILLDYRRKHEGYIKCST